MTEPNLSLLNRLQSSWLTASHLQEDFQHVLPALKVWRKKRLQALLSMLGIAAGIIGLVNLLALGEGAKREMDAAMGAYGAGTLIIQNASEETESISQLNSAQMQRFKQLMGDDLLNASMSWNTQVNLYAENTEVPQVSLVATDRNYADFHNLSAQAGRFLTDIDLAYKSQTCVLGAALGKTLFPRQQVVGQKVRIDNEWCTVVGWLKPLADTLSKLDVLSLSQLDQSIFIPVTWHQTHSLAVDLDQILLQFDSEQSMISSMSVAQRVTRVDHPEAALEFIVPVQLIRQKQELQRTFGFFLLAVTVIIIAVGGIGVMNIMMVNIASRKQEIGLRRALGASDRDILAQFMTESMVICFAGGIAGVLMGFVFSNLIDWLTGWPSEFSLYFALVGFAASVLLGVLFGSYPARKAALLSPVEALYD